MTDGARGGARADGRSSQRTDYPPDWDARRKRVYRRDDYTCQNCGRKSGPHATNGNGVRLHAHHVVPKSKGGSNGLDNLVTLCESCHNRAHDHDITASMSGGTTTGRTGGKTATGGTTRTSTHRTTDEELEPSVAPELFVLLTYPLYMGGSLTVLHHLGVYPAGMLPFWAAAGVFVVYSLVFLFIPSQSVGAGVVWTVLWASILALGGWSSLVSVTTLWNVAAWVGVPLGILALQTARRRVGS